MIDDTIPIIHRLEGRTIKCWAIGDVHIGAKECDLKGFQKFITDKVLKDPDSYLLLCGDIVNNGVRASSCPTDIYAETMPPQAAIEKAAEILEPVKDRILGAVSGNHENRSKKAVDLDCMYAIMCILGKQDVYRQNMAFIRIRLGDSTYDTYAILLVHGKSENKKRQFAYTVEGVSAIVSGHTHNGLIEKPARLVFTSGNNVKVKSLVSLTATSWLSYGGYGARGLYKPVTHSQPAYLELEWTGSNSIEGQIKAIW